MFFIITSLSAEWGKNLIFKMQAINWNFIILERKIKTMRSNEVIKLYKKEALTSLTTFLNIFITSKPCNSLPIPLSKDVPSCLEKNELLP